MFLSHHDETKYQLNKQLKILQEQLKVQVKLILLRPFYVGKIAAQTRFFLLPFDAQNIPHRDIFRLFFPLNKRNRLNKKSNRIITSLV